MKTDRTPPAEALPAGPSRREFLVQAGLGVGVLSLGMAPGSPAAAAPAAVSSSGSRPGGTLRGARIFVAGGGSGIGAAIARMAVARGAHVALAGRKPGKLKAVAGGLGTAVLGLHSLDAANQGQVEAALAAHAPYDHIVTAAADLTFAPFTSLTDAQIGRVLDSKLSGPINLARAADRHLTPQGSVLLFSRLAAYRQGPGTSVVGAVNLALQSLVAALAIELRPRRFNVLSPGVVDSDSWAGMSGRDRAAFLARTAASLPAGRVGMVQDVAHAALALLENGFINGTVLHVDGGGRIA